MSSTRQTSKEYPAGGRPGKPAGQKRKAAACRRQPSRRGWDVRGTIPAGVSLGVTVCPAGTGRTTVGWGTMRNRRRAYGTEIAGSTGRQGGELHSSLFLAARGRGRTTSGRHAADPAVGHPGGVYRVQAPSGLCGGGLVAGYGCDPGGGREPGHACLGAG